MRRAAENPKKKFFKPWKHTTAVSLRLTEPWHGTKRVVAGDSYFASVNTCKAFGEYGLDFIGDVKTASAQFCKDALEAATGSERGAWATYQGELKLSNGDVKKVGAVSHRRGGVVHKFIFTAGTTLPGNAHTATFEDEEDRYRVAVNQVIERKCPKVFNDYSLAQPKIDRHNRYRQFILAMEKRVLSNRFCVRLATTLWAMVITW